MVSCHPWGQREVIHSSSPQNIPHARDVLRQRSTLGVIVWKQFVKYNSLSPIEVNEGCKNDSYLTYFKSQFDIYNLWKLFLKVAVFKMYWIYHMPLRHWWMVGCVAKEINTEPHSLALKKNHAVCLDIKEIRQGILGKLHICPLCLSCFGGVYSLPWKDMSPWTMGFG